MNIDLLAQLNAIEPIGDLANLSALKRFEELDNLVHQVSLRNSKPFRVRNEMLTPTLQLHQFDSAVRNLVNTIAQPNFPLILNEYTKVKSTSLYALNKIQSTLNQNKWFDLQTINQLPYKAQVHSYLDALWNEIRGYNSSRDVKLDNTYRNKLIRDQRTENSKMVSRLLTKHSNVQASRLFFNLNFLGDFSNIELNQIEKRIYELKTKLISQLQQLNLGNLYCIQWRVQRSLPGFYYLNVLVYHTLEHLIKLPQVQNELVYKFNNAGQQTISLNQNYFNIQTYTLGSNQNQSIELEQWKVIFNQMLYSLKYYYYQSKVISPKFTSITY